MTANFPYTPSMDMTHMYDMPDFNGGVTEVILKDSLWDFLQQPCFSIFRRLVQLSRMDVLFNNCQANFTLFVPIDEHIKDIDLAQFSRVNAIEIVRKHSMDKWITEDLLRYSPIMYLDTRNTKEKILVTTIGQDLVLNSISTVISPNHILCNGIVHVINTIL
jgi:hypothetical protein